MTARTLRRPGPSITAALVWLSVYVAAAATGARLRTDTLATDWQILPLDALRADPIGSVWNLHTQPPLWNLFLGVTARWSPFDLAGSLWLFMGLCGAVLVWALCEIGLLLGLTRRVAVALAVLAALQPAVLDNLWTARYEMPVTTLLALLVWAMATRRPAWWVGTATALVLLRSLYHPAFLVVLVLVWWWLRRPVWSWSSVLRVALVPLLLIGGWMAKTADQVGSPTLSSWSGMNALRSVQGAVDQQTLSQLEARGVISGVGAVPSFSPYEAYETSVPPCTVTSSEPAVALETKGTTTSPLSGETVDVPNFNHLCFAAVYDLAGDDFWALMRHQPEAWMRARLWSVDNWFGIAPRSDAGGPVVRTLGEVGRIGLLAVPHPPVPSSWRGHEVWAHRYPLSISLAVCTLALLIAATRTLRRRSLGPGALVVAASGVVVAWTIVIGVIAELGEQDRFRGVLDPLVVVVGGTIALRWIGPRLRGRLRALQPPASVVLAAAVVVAGIGFVALRRGDPTVLTTRPTTTSSSSTVVPGTTVPGTTAPSTTTVVSTTTTVAPRPECTHVVHLGDSNLGLSTDQFTSAYRQLGIEATIDHANGRGATTARDGGTSAVDAIAIHMAQVPATGRCWVIALSDTDAATSWRDGVDPTASIEAIAAAVHGEPVVWVTPVLVSTVSEWNLDASTAYNRALSAVAERHPEIHVLDWQDIALDHLDQFNADGIHYTDELYGLLVRTVLGELLKVWSLSS